MQVILPLSEIPPDLWPFFEPLDAATNPPDVMKIAAEPLREKHYAAFPSELVRRCLLASTSSKGYCPSCGLPWCRVVETTFVPQPDVKNWNGVTKAGTKGLDESSRWGETRQGCNSTKTLDWRPACNCPAADPRPALVLDPFSGSGRTGLTCQQLGLDFVGIDLNPEYVEMSRRLLYEASPLFS